MSPFHTPTGLSLGLNDLHIPHIRFTDADVDREAGEHLKQQITKGCEAFRLWVYEMAASARHEVGADLDPKGLAIRIGEELQDNLLAAIEQAVEGLPASASDLSHEHRIGAHEAGVRTGRAA